MIYHGSRSKAEGVFHSGCSLSIPPQYVTAARNWIGKKPGIWRHMFLRCQCGYKSLQICKANDRWREGSACTANESLQLKVDILKPVSLCWFLRACCSQRCGDVAKTAHRSEVDAKKHERQKSDWNDWKGYQQCVKHRFKVFSLQCFLLKGV